MTSTIGGAERIAARFAKMKAEGRGGLIAFVTAGDPDMRTGLEILKGLPAAGADVIELGMPFSDPMADGPAIQKAGNRALAAGMTLRGLLSMVRDFRDTDRETPVVLMGYYNPIHVYGVAAFLEEALGAGVDGLIVVDLPPEEDAELCLPALAKGLSFIRLATPTTDDARLPRVLSNTSGFVYYVSVAGVTGADAGGETQIDRSLARLRARTDLPIAVGFGIKTPDHAARIVRTAEAAVVGSALVSAIENSLDAQGRATGETVVGVLDLVRDLAAGVRGVRR